MPAPTAKQLETMSDEDFAKLDAASELDEIENADPIETDEEEEEQANDDTSTKDDDDDSAAAKDDDNDDDAAAAAAKDDGDAGKGGKEPKIPKSRLDEVIRERNDERKAAEEARLEAALLRQQLELSKPAAPKDEPAPALDLKPLYAALEEATLDGDNDKIIAARMAIDDAREKRLREEHAKQLAEAEARAEQRVSAKLAQQQAATAAQDVYKEFPFLDSKSAKADPDAIELVIVKRDRAIAEGKDPVLAMLEAAREVGKKFAKIHGVSVPGKDKTAEELAREKAAGNAIDRSTRQPAAPVGAGASNRQHSGVKLTAKQVANMTDEQIRKLEKENPEALNEAS